MTAATYRTRVYTHYVQAREQALAPRSHALRRLIRRNFRRTGTLPCWI